MIGPKVHKWSSRADESTGREIVMLRDKGVCVRCRRVDPVFGVNHDHRKNRSQGGDWAPSNGQLMCGSGTTGCHGFVTSHPKAALAEGYAVPSWGDPAEWPARRWIKTDNGTVREGWVLYDDDGTYEEITEAEAMERMQGAGW
jgi:hypothetical protein